MSFIHNHKIHLMRFGSVKLKPGDNKLTDAQIKELEPFMSGIRSAIKAGWLTIEEKPLEAVTASEADDQLSSLFDKDKEVVVAEDTPSEKKDPIDELLGG